METITRFAPSPTGSLHIGGVRTALYNWLYAKSQNGQFVLRIEDTDKERSSDESTLQILQTMEWLGLDYKHLSYQSKRQDIYQQAIEKLLNQGDAYYCKCSMERLDTLRKEQMANKQKPRYDGNCRNLNLSKSDGYVVRLKTPQAGNVSFDDAVRGTISVNNNELDDLVIMRSDNSPTYNLSCVIDDADMNISLVMRGDDHINNTPRQINIYQLLNLKVPKFAHMPMILGPDGKRLSKRHGALSALEYREQGFINDALLNYLARLGWSHGDKEIFTRQELIDYFNLSNINKSPATFNNEKLKWTNSKHLSMLTSKQLVSIIEDNSDIKLSPQVISLIPLYIERCNTTEELKISMSPYTKDSIKIDPKAEKKHLNLPAIEPLQTIANKLNNINEWKVGSIKAAIDETIKELNIGMGKLGMPVRVAITGNSFSPSVELVLFALGKNKSLNRIRAAIDIIK